MVLTLLITVFIILTTEVNCCYLYKVGDGRTNLEEARDICEGDGEGEGEGGRLLRVEDLADPGLKNLITLQNLPTNSCVWIDGNVTYSPFVYWEGCYDLSIVGSVQGNVSIKNENATSIYHCTKFCQDKTEHSHIGLGKDTCYCFNDLLQFNLLLSSSTCNVSCHHSAFIGESCGSMSAIDVYGISSSVNIQNAHELLPYVQCVFTKCDEPHCNYTVTSCDNKTVTGGYLCEGNSSVYKHNQCSPNKCADRVGCTIFKENDWIVAWLECRRGGGRLVDQPENFFNESVFPNSCFNSKPDHNSAFWTGIFRTVYFTSDTAGSRCWRVGNNTIENVLVDNSTFNYYVCKHESDNTQTTASTFTDRTEPPTDHFSVYTFNLWSFLAVVIGSSLVLIIFPATCFVLCRNSKRRTQSPSDAVIVYSTVEKNVWAGTDGNGGNMDDTDSVYDVANHDRRNVHLQTTEFDTYSHLTDKDGAIGHPGDIYNNIKPNQNDRYNTDIYGNIDSTTEEHKELGIGQSDSSTDIYDRVSMCQTLKA